MIYEVYEQKYRVQHAELKQLQSQINPHFMYNSLFILYRLSTKTGDETLIRFSKYLGDYFEFITRNSRDEVSLQEEVRHSRNYVEVQLIRFSNQIHVEFEELPPAFNNVQVPRIILQPVMENAYKYALEPKERDALLRIHFIVEPHGLIIVVEDNGEVIDAVAVEQLQQRLNSNDPTEETSGIVNVHRRLQYLFGPEYGLSVSVSPIGGLRVTIKIPHYDQEE
jgi:two-component system sensor histidine kinase YesM